MGRIIVRLLTALWGVASRLALPVFAGSALLGCAQVEVAPHLLPLPPETMMLLGKKGMDAQAPIYVRIFKEESELEVWKERENGRYYHFKTYPICNWSGDIGPKIKQGDRQAPEGFYVITREQMNPDSHYHLAMNLGFPNAFDRAQGRTGEYLMIHGKCKSAGCYAMTDALIEEIYAIARESFLGGHDSFPAHAFPFRMTPQNMARHANHEAYRFWLTMKEAYDYFELTRQVPTIAICNRRYVVNVALRSQDPSQLDPEGACPAFQRPKPVPFTPATGASAELQIVVPGPKMHAFAGAEADAPRSGLTSAGPSGAYAGPSVGFAPQQ
jgi:murein L,D-transpeptidase YafK